MRQAHIWQAEPPDTPWVLVIDRDEGRIDPTGLEMAGNGQAYDLTRGGVLLECALPSDLPSLFDCSELDLQIFCLDDDICLRSGSDEARLGLKGHVGPLRLIYNWDVKARHASLALETLDAPLRICVAPVPQVSGLEICPSLMVSSRIDAAVDLLAFAAAPIPTGPYPGLVGATRLLTANGALPVAELQRGDLLRTQTGELVPVLHRLSRSLPARGSFAPVRLFAPAFELRHDVIVSAAQELVLAGADVEYTFGCETVRLPVRHLIGSAHARQIQSSAVIDYHQLILPRNEGLRTGGALLSSLNIGRLRRNKTAWAVSGLKHIVRNALPEHAPSPCRVLTQAETRALIDLRAA